jgi:hypothetical protein
MNCLCGRHFSKLLLIDILRSEAMRFSWASFVLAPLLVPFLFCAAFASLAGGNNLVFSFLILMIPSCIISYGTTIFLFLPALFLLSLFRPLTALNVCLLGLVLGALVFVPVTAMEWKSSGPDSGPPTENFFGFFVRWAADPFTAVYPVAGLVTAAFYWWLGSRRRGSNAPEPAI